MWHIPNLLLQYSPKERKIKRTPSGQENEEAKANHPVYSSVDVGQEISLEDIEELRYWLSKLV
jgi:hypothetical protein